MSSLSLRVCYRPPRIGWCIADGAWEEFRQAVRLTCTLWGGRFNPIIVVGDDVAAAERLVSTFRVDALYPLSDRPSVVSFSGKFSHLPWPDVHKKLFIEGASGPLPVFLDAYHPLRRINESGANHPTTVQRTVRVRAQSTDPLRDVLLATFGDYPSREECPIDYAEIAARLAGLTIVALAPDGLMSYDAWKNLCPTAVSEFDLLVHKPRGGWDSPGVFVGRETDFGDLITFWNLRAADIAVQFLPERDWRRIGPMVKGWADELTADLKQGRFPFKDRIAIWTSVERDFATYKDLLGKELSIHLVTSTTWNGLNVKPPRVHFEEETVLATLEERGQRFSLTFALPKKPFYDTPGTYYENSILTTVVPLEPIPSGWVFRYPYIPELNEFYGREAYFDPTRARIEPKGLGLFVKSYQGYLTINAIPSAELVARIFSLAGITAKQSIAGHIARRVIAHMGDLEACRVFKIRGVRQLLREFGPTTSFTHSQALARIGQGFEPYRGLFIEYRETGDLRPQDAFLYLVKKRVFRAGLELECRDCLLEEWYSINDLGETIECRYCGKPFDSGPQLRDKVWAYRLSGLFARALDHEDAIPVALTLLQIHRGSQPHSMTYTCGMDLSWNAGGNRVRGEVDLVAITEGVDYQPILVPGECKTNKKVSEEQINKLLAVSDRLGRLTIKPFILFSKAGALFEQDELELVDQKQTIDLNFILLTPVELEPYHPYEAAEKAGTVPTACPVSIEEWAANSQKLYLKTTPQQIRERYRAARGAGPASPQS